MQAGGRMGGAGVSVSRPLHSRLREHAQSINAATNLVLGDFKCRLLVVEPLWVTMAERFLIEHFRPVWNSCVDGFGIHDPGGGRRKGEASWWDTLHPGRSWVAKQRRVKTRASAEQRVREFLKREPPRGAL